MEITDCLGKDEGLCSITFNLRCSGVYHTHQQSFIGQVRKKEGQEEGINTEPIYC